MNREELLSAVETLVEDGATPLEQHIARETILDMKKMFGFSCYSREIFTVKTQLTTQVNKNYSMLS